jgi:ketohexokinase
MFIKLNDNYWWVHFEGRNITETLGQIDWLNQKANAENWRHQLVISIEIEKPERPDIELLIEKVKHLFGKTMFY